MNMDNTATITVKGMVCNRCILSIKAALEKIGVQVKDVHLGKVEVYKTPGINMTDVQDAITCLGFEILVDKREKIVDSVKKLVNDVLSLNQYTSIKFSTLISDYTNSNYDTVSSIFSAKEGITLEHYIINQKIERVKKLLLETNLSLTEISFQTNYSSVHHLSKQFKVKQGLNPSEFRTIQSQRETSIKL
jgi:AraC family transcriptional regulator